MSFRAGHASRGIAVVPTRDPSTGMTAIPRSARNDSLDTHARPYSLRPPLRVPAASHIARLRPRLDRHVRPRIGASTAIFSAVDGVLLKSLPYRDPGNLVQVWESSPPRNFSNFPVTPSNLADWRAQARSFSGLAASRPRRAILTAGTGEPERVPGVAVSTNYFQVLGLSAHIGRTFAPADSLPAAERPVVLAYGFWVRRFGADSSLVGKPITLDGSPFTVIGVLSSTVRTQAQLWTPLTIPPPLMADRNAHMLAVIGRLAPGRHHRRRTTRHGRDQHSARRSLSGVQQGLDGDARAAARSDRRQAAPRTHGAHGGRGVRAAHRVRERREPHARSRLRSRARSCGARRARCRPTSHRGADAHREPRHRAFRRCGRCRRRIVRGHGAAIARACQSSAAGRHRRRWSRTGVRTRGIAGHSARVRSAARAAGLAHRPLERAA